MVKTLERINQAVWELRERVSLEPANHAVPMARASNTRHPPQPIEVFFRTPFKPTP